MWKSLKNSTGIITTDFYGISDGESGMLEQRFNAYVRIGGTLTQRATSDVPDLLKHGCKVHSSFILMWIVDF